MNIQSLQHPVLPTLLIILDGFGIAKHQEGNAITHKTAPHIFQYMAEYPTSLLTAHGEAVGLFPGQEGNSEAGHFNIGAGRVVKQDLVRISEAIDDGTFFKHDAFVQAVTYAKKHKSAVHVVGLLTDGNSAHANPKHLYAILASLKKHKQKEVYLHLFTDGRDSPQHAAVEFLKDLRGVLTTEKIASVSGRIYGMDRNKIWERTQAAYELLVLGKGGYYASSAEEAIANAYNRNETDEYISPTIIHTKQGHPTATIQEHDVIIMFNARSDRARQLTKAFVQKEFQKKNNGAFRRKKTIKQLLFVAMTDFGPDLPGIYTAFPSPDIVNSLPCAIGKTKTCKQLYISESEKYAHVTYFLNGGYEKPICGEERYLVPSSRTWNFAKKPQMQAKQVTKTILEKMKKEGYTFVAVNFPNADMVGHTGDFVATTNAIAVIDREVATLVTYVLKQKGQVLITADHGNAEMMQYKETKEPCTEHSTNPVPCILIRKDLKGKKIKHTKGTLADVAPTLLHLMDIPKPKEMTGTSLI